MAGLTNDSHAHALAQHLVTLVDFHHDDDADLQHADPIKTVDLFCDETGEAAFVVSTDSGRRFRVLVKELLAGAVA